MMLFDSMNFPPLPGVHFRFATPPRTTLFSPSINCCRNSRPTLPILLVCASPSDSCLARPPRVARSVATSSSLFPKLFPIRSFSASSRSLIFLRPPIPTVSSRLRKAPKICAFPEPFRVHCSIWKMDGNVSAHRFTRPAASEFWIAPIETVSESEGGFERVYQGSQILALWRPDLTVHTSFSSRLLWRLESF